MLGLANQLLALFHCLKVTVWYQSSHLTLSGKANMYMLQNVRPLFKYMHKCFPVAVHVQCLCVLACKSSICSSSNNQCSSTVRVSVFPQAWQYLVHLSQRISTRAGAEAKGGVVVVGVSLGVTWCEKRGAEGIWYPPPETGTLHVGA